MKELPIFFCPPERWRNDTIELPSEEGHHAVSVRRLTKGDRVIVIDGVGTAYRGEIAKIVGKKKVEIKPHLEIRNFGEPAVALTLAAGLSVGSKFDTVIQKGTELGVKRFVPIIAEQSKVRLDDVKKTAAKTRRFERVALAAVKQCRRSYRPEIAFPVGFAEYMREADPDSVKLVFHPIDKTTQRNHTPTGSNLHGLTASWEQLLANDYIKRVTVLVGPESGFTRDEIDMANKAGFVTISLGPRILRTETAGPVVCALVMNVLGELR